MTAPPAMVRPRAGSPPAVSLAAFAVHTAETPREACRQQRFTDAYVELVWVVASDGRVLRARPRRRRDRSRFLACSG